MKNALWFASIVGLLLQACTFLDGWSPEKSGLIFTSNRSGNPEIYLRERGDTTWINLTSNSAADNWPSLSPDGNRIVFQSTRSGKLDIWIMNRDGSALKRLTTRSDHDYLPSFTPDGNQITFTSWRTESKDERRTPHIYIMNTDGTAQRRLVEKPTKTSTGVSWHPSGTRFVFSRKLDGNATEIFEADRDGNINNQLTNANLQSSAAEYSPDGTRIAYYEEDDNSSRIIVMNSDGTGKTTIVNDGKNYYPRWAPNGEWITYSKVTPGTGDKEINIYTVALIDTSKQIEIVGHSARNVEGRWFEEINY